MGFKGLKNIPNIGEKLGGEIAALMEERFRGGVL